MENEKIEYKIDITKNKSTKDYNFLKDVVAFLNTDGGEIIFGVDDKTKEYIGFSIQEFDDKYEKIKNTTLDSILPNISDLVDFEEIENRCIKIIISNITKNKPYYLKKYGRSSKGVYIRKGPSSIPLDDYQIDQLYKKHRIPSLKDILAEHQKFSFKNLETRFEIEMGEKLSDIKKLNLGIVNEDEKITMLGQLFSDENNNSITISKFDGNDKTSNLIYTTDYGECPLYISFEKIISQVEVENPSIVKSINISRMEEYNFQPQALREAILNSFVHNDYTIGFPKFYIFKNRIEICSFGGLLPTMSIESFFKGRSKSRNPEIVKIFKLFKETESIGRGIPKILEYYSKDIFTILDDELIISFPSKLISSFAQNDTSFAQNDTSFAQSDTSFAQSDTSFAQNDTSFAQNDTSFAQNDTSFAQSDTSFALNHLSKLQIKQSIFHDLDNNQTISAKELSQKYNLTNRTAQIYLKELFEENKLIRRKEGRSYIYMKKDES